MRIYVGMCMHAHSLLRQLLDLLIGACVCLKDMYGTAASRSGVGGANVFCQLSSHAIAYVLSVEAISFTMRIYCTDQAHIRVE